MSGIKPGDRARIIGGVDGLNIGVVVEVGQYLGEHSKYGPIFHVVSLGPDIVTEYGAIGKECDCAAAWLRKLPPVEPPLPAVKKDELVPA
jgi:hypothetical protein